MSNVTIVGAGLAGSLLAIYLARRGFAVDVFEARPDMRMTEIAAGRSINLALSDRGIAALREIGMDEYMLAEAVPMYGRMIHSPTGETKLLPYSGRKGEYINSVSRAGLNIALMNEAEKYPGVMFHFQHRCIGVNAETGEVMFENGSTAAGDTVIATDGAGSVLRASFANEVPSFRHEEVFLEHGYKELHIPPGDTGSFQLEKNALHIWPRRQFMMIALPNFDGSFTCTLFLAKSVTPAAAGASIQSFQDPEPAFDRFSGEQSVRAFFENQFPDAVPLMPSMVEDFFNNPTGNLGTVKCWPWNIGGKVLLLGDSAHAMVPFYGQGMNCAFEDVRVLAGLIDDQLFTTKTQNGQVADIDWNMVFNEYCGLRKPNTDAIQEMAEENFFEMRDATADLVFQRKRELETKLEQTYPEYFSKYSMVTFREDLPYKVAKERGIAQDELLTDICSRILSVEELNLQEIMDSVRTLKAGV